MICLIPVSRFRVEYEVAAGRPYSQLEVMILRAIKAGLHDVESLRATFQMHPRILIEGLVTLTQAGWVATSNSDDGGFVLTAEGADAVDGHRTPSTTVITPKTETVLLERVTGGLIGNHEVRFSTRAQLKTAWDDAIRLTAEVAESEADEGQVRQLLRRAKGEWVRWVGPIDLIGKNAHWVVVSVDPESGSVTGLPERWERRLGPVIAEEARRREQAISPAARARTWNLGESRGRREQVGESDGTKAWPVQLRDSDVLCDDRMHAEHLRQALTEARTTVFVASAFLASQAIGLLKEPLSAALRRGVDVDLLWGYDEGGTGAGAPLEELKRIAYDARQAAGAGVLRFNKEASGSHAKLLLWDSSGGMHATVGSFNWLSAFGHDGGVNVSVTLHEPGIVAGAAACAAGLWASASSETLSSAPDRWRNIAAELERIASQSGDALAADDAPACTARLVFDREHDVLFREWLRTSQSRCLALSHRLGPAAEARLAAAPVATERRLWVGYGTTELDESWQSRIASRVESVGGTLRKVQGLHAKLIVSDTSVCVSSYNFLSADPFGTSKRARELGVVLEGAESAALVAANVERLFTE